MTVIICSGQKRFFQNTNVTILTQGLRLVNGNGFSSGRVELLYNGTWGTVCDHLWSDLDALVVCRSLGLDGGLARSGGHYGVGQGVIWLDNVSCYGYEHSLLECRSNRIGEHNCAHGDDAGVDCVGTSHCF